MMPSTCTLSDRVLAWNNTAIANILDGKPSECLDVLRYALSQVQNELQDEANGPVQSLKRRLPSNKLSEETEFQSIALQHMVPTTPCDHGNGTFAFYNRMVTRDSKQSHTSSHLLCMLFFNLAVAHHQLGLSSGQSAELTTALQLYQLAFSMVEGSASDFLLGDQQMLLLALYNNMGHIHSCFCRTAETQACVQWIQQVFLAFPKAAPFLESRDFQFFVQYMSLNPTNQGSVASAA